MLYMSTVKKDVTPFSQMIKKEKTIMTPIKLVTPAVDCSKSQFTATPATNPEYVKGVHVL
jgi:hypothetical protein